MAVLDHLGIGIAFLNDHKLGCGVFAVLPGVVHTALCAEVYAILVVCILAARNATVTIVTDSFAAFRSLHHPDRAS